MTPLPSPQQLRYLVALAEHGHFGRAADACAVTQSTLSAGILALERQLDAPLLHRDATRRVVFTTLGRELVGRARDALVALGALVEAADAARAPMSGPVRLGVIPTIGPFLVPRLVPAIRAAFPRLKVYLREDTTARLVERIAVGELDVALLALPCACAGSDTLPVARDDFLVALPPDHPLATLETVGPATLVGESLLLLEDGHCLRDQAVAACGFAPAAGPGGETFAATSLHTLVQMVAGGLGVTLLPRLAAGLVAGTGVVLRPLGGAAAHRTLGLAWRSGAPRAADFRALGPLLAASVPDA